MDAERTPIAEESSSSTPGPDIPETGNDGLRQQVTEGLRSVDDPELGINIVDLGLVYEVDIKDG